MMRNAITFACQAIILIVVLNSCSSRGESATDRNDVHVETVYSKPVLRIGLTIPISELKEDIDYDLDFVDSIIGVGSCKASFKVNGRHLILNPFDEFDDTVVVNVKTTDTIFSVQFYKQSKQPVSHLYEVHSDTLLPISEVMR